MTTKTYFLPPDFLCYPAGDCITTGRIQLGQLIHDIDDPAYTIKTLPPLDLKPSSKDLTLYSAIEVHLFVKAAGLVGANFSISTSDSEKLLAAVDKLQSATIDPSDAYVIASIGQKEVQTWLNARWFGKRIFMVTSVLTAYPSNDSKVDLSTHSSTEIDGSGEGDATLPTAGHIPAKGGFKSKGTFQKEFALAFVPNNPFVYGFQVRECFYTKKEGSSKAYHKGAKLHSDKGEEQRAADDEVAQFEASGLAQEEVSFDDLGDMDEKFVSHDLDGEEFSFVAPGAGH